MKTMTPFIAALAILIVPYAAFAEDVTVSRVSTTETIGTISEFLPNTLVIRTETSSSPINYSYTSDTSYVDEGGAPVSMETVRSGLPVTVYYTNEGNRLVAKKVVVRKTTTTTGGPITEEKRTTTTTTNTQVK